MDVDLRADVYGVGAIVYEILSGEAVNLDCVVLAAQGTDGWPHLPPLSASRADVPRALDAVIFKALADDKDIGAWVRSQLDRDASSAR